VRVGLATPAIAGRRTTVAAVTVTTRCRPGGVLALVSRARATDVLLVTRESTALVAPHVADVPARVDPFSASRHQGTSCSHRDHRRLQG
jgi:hypothetical protein